MSDDIIDLIIKKYKEECRGFLLDKITDYDANACGHMKTTAGERAEGREGTDRDVYEIMAILAAGREWIIQQVL